jgi:hypothetical protein
LLEYFLVGHSDFLIEYGSSLLIRRVLITREVP